MNSLRVNVGCGGTPTPGWTNFDNSWTLRIAEHPRATRLLGSLGVLGATSVRFAEIAREHGIRWADAVRRIPLPDGAAHALYSSHMLEHLDRQEARSFLREVRRVLASGGVLRIAVPDLSLLARRYLSGGDADAFVSGTLLAEAKPRTIAQHGHRLLVGPRHHHWMYDGNSLLQLVVAAGFEGASIMAAGATTISDPGDLDLFERVEESVYVEGRRP